MIDKNVLKSLKEELDLQENDKFYIVRQGIREIDGNKVIQTQRIARGYNAFELMGLLESSKLDIYNQIKGLSEKPNIIEKKYLKGLKK